MASVLYSSFLSFKVSLDVVRFEFPCSLFSDLPQYIDASGYPYS